MWNLRQDPTQNWQPTQMRLTLFAEAHVESQPTKASAASDPSLAEPSFGPPQWARAARMGSLGGLNFVPQLDGTLRCPQGQRSTRRNDASNTTERSACSTPPVSPTVARAPCARSVKDMARSPKNPVA